MNTALSPKVHGERCTRYRFRYSECSRCAGACPHDALRLSEEGAEIDASACRHCGLCFGACPTDAFQSGSFSRAALVRAAKEAKAYTLACAPSGAGGDMTVPCLGVLDAPTAAFVLSRGTDLTLAGLAHCGQCANGAKVGAALDLLSAGVEHARAALDGAAWGRLLLNEGEGARVDRRGADRRHFFRRLVAGGAARLTEGEAVVTIPAKAVRAGPHYRPLNRELVDLLLGERTMTSHPAFPAARVAATPDACTGCELCDRVCPTGALQSFEEDGWWQLQFRSHQCVGCGVCIEACQPGALALAEQVAAGPREGERLLALRRNRCERCGRLYVPTSDETACPVCADDDQSFAAIFG